MLPKIGILCAGDDELAPFLPLLDRRSVRRQAMLTIHEGWISSVPAAALYSGVCKVNAAIAAQVLIDSCRVGNTEAVLGYSPTEVSPYVTWKCYAYDNDKVE